MMSLNFDISEAIF